MLFYVTYGVSGCSDNYLIIDAEDEAAANDWVYQEAIREYESYEGLHGIRSYSDICAEDFVEDEMTDEDYDEAEEIYQEERENTISYGVTPFDDNMTEHTDALEEMGVYEI
jgi:hypothetical protein